MIAEAIQFPQINPSALTLPFEFDLLWWHLGPFHLRWYALAYIAGLVLGWRWMVWLIRRERLWAPGKPSLSVPQTDDFLFWATLGVILGGRFGYVLFYKLDMIWKIAPDNPWWSGLLDVFRVWEGGMSFHGGLIGVALAAFFFAYRKVQVRFQPTLGVTLVPRTHVNEEQFAALAKKSVVAQPPTATRREYRSVGSLGWLKKKDFALIREKASVDKIGLLGLGDLAAAAAPIGLFFGRIANFINGELWGRHTDAPWGVVFPEGGYNWATRQWQYLGFEQARHPSQLYEAALEGVALFAIINVLTLRFESLRRPGLNVGAFLVCYGLFRFLMEFVREPDAHMPEALRGYVTMGMLLSVPMILAGAWLIRRAYASPKTAAA